MKRSGLLQSRHTGSSVGSGGRCRQFKKQITNQAAIRPYAAMVAACGAADPRRRAPIWRKGGNWRCMGGENGGTAGRLRQ